MTGETGFNPLAELWDYRSRAIVEASKRLERLSDPDREQALRSLTEQVRSQTAVLNDDWLAMVALILVEDLYASYYYSFEWRPTTAAYLSATAGAFLEELAKRGFVVHYVVDATVGDANPGEMLTYLPALFGAAGFMVLGPQLLALKVLERSGGPGGPSAFASALAEGQVLAEELVTRCHAERRPSVYLNLDLNDDAPALPLGTPLSPAGSAGTILVFRDQPPIVGGPPRTALPPGVSLPRAAWDGSPNPDLPNLSVPPV